MSSSEASKDIIKKSFETREGVYRISEYIEGHPRQQQQSGYGRPGFQASGTDSNNPTAPVRISCSHLEIGDDENGNDENSLLEHICFNHGRELHFMPFSLSKQQQQQQNHSSDSAASSSETTKMYKGTIPTCHDVLVPSPLHAQMLATSIRNKTEQAQQQTASTTTNGSTNGITSNGQQEPQQASSVSSNLGGELNSRPRFFVLVGFGAGQIQLFEASMPQQYVFFNESRATDASRVSSIKWVPHSPTKFLAAHASGHIYLYDTALPCDHQKPTFVQVKTPQVQSPIVSLFVNKNKQENPTHRLSLRTGCVNQIAFSRCGHFLALACQDGFLRAFRFGAELNALELCVQVRSFFGGFTCVAWSPDGRYLATGGEDDLVTLVSFADNRVVCRGRGHRSWITAVAFDNMACVCGALPPPNQQQQAPPSDPPLVYRLASVGQDTLLCLWELTEDVLVSSQLQLVQKQRLRSRSSLLVNNNANGLVQLSGSATIRNPPVKQSATESSNILSIATSNSNEIEAAVSSSNQQQQQLRVLQRSPSNTPSPASTVGSASGSSLAGVLASKFAFWHRDKYKGGSKKSKKKQQQQQSLQEKRGSLTSTTSALVEHQYPLPPDHPAATMVNSSCSSHQVRSSVSDLANLNNGGGSSTPPLLNGSPPQWAVSNGCTLLGTAACPRLGDVPVIDPLVLKKVAADPLSGVAFLKECLLTACQAGYLAVWSRPTTIAGAGGPSKENNNVSWTANDSRPIEKQVSLTSGGANANNNNNNNNNSNSDNNNNNINQQPEVASSFL